MRDEVADVAYRLGWGGARYLPAPLAAAATTVAADQAWLAHGAGVRQLEANLARVRPGLSRGELRTLSRAGMRSTFRYYLEAFRLPDMDHAALVAAVRVVDEQYLADPIAAGTGVVVALPHLANWDHAGAWACLVHAPVTTVVERLHPESLYRRFLDYRTRLGMDAVPLSGPGSGFRPLVDAARANRIVALLADRDLTGHGVDVTFFGEPARMPAGPAALALASGAPLVPATLSYDGPALVVAFHPPVAAPVDGTRAERTAAMTQSLAQVFQAGIGAHPADWHMLQPLWLADHPAVVATQATPS